MNFRIQADDLPVTVLEAVGLVANHARLRVADVENDPGERTVSFPLERYSITGRSLFAQTRHAKTPVRCRVTFRNVIDCEIQDRTEGKGLSTVHLLFGFKIEKSEIYLCSAAEHEGRPCYELSCRVSGLDIEFVDVEDAPTTSGT